MELTPDLTDLAMLLTDKERASIAVALLPHRCRGAVDRACGTSKQSRCNARARARAKLLKAQAA